LSEFRLDSIFSTRLNGLILNFILIKIIHFWHGNRQRIHYEMKSL